MSDCLFFNKSGSLQGFFLMLISKISYPLMILSLSRPLPQFSYNLVIHEIKGLSSPDIHNSQQQKLRDVIKAVGLSWVLKRILSIRFWDCLKWQENGSNRHKVRVELWVTGETRSGLNQNGSNGKGKGNTCKRH